MRRGGGGGVWVVQSSSLVPETDSKGVASLGTDRMSATSYVKRTRKLFGCRNHQFAVR